jgi:hypothetical protein
MMTTREMIELYERGASLRTIANMTDLSYEGVRKSMIGAGFGERMRRAKEDRRLQKEAELEAVRIQRDQQRARRRKESRTQIDHRTEQPPVPMPAKAVHRSDRIENDAILRALAAWLRDPEAEGRGPLAYDRWRERHTGAPSSATAIKRLGSWSNAKAMALNLDLAR